MARSRYLIPTEDQPRIRRAADITRGLIGVLIFLWAWRSYGRAADPEVALTELIGGIPEWLTELLSIFYTLALLFVVGLFIAVLTQWRHRSDAIRDMVLAGLATGLLVTIIVRVVSGTWPQVLIELGRADTIAQFPMIRVAVTASLLLVVAPHLTRPLRQVSWFVVLVVSVAGVGIGLGLPSSAIGAISIGAVAAALILVVFGSPRGLPDPTSITASLRAMGLDIDGARLDDDQSWGVRRLVAESADHGRVEIKAYGRDATDSQLAVRWWRYLWYRDTTSSLALTRMQSVEHEALVAMMAEKTGASVPKVLVAGLGGDDVAILAVDREGRRLTELDPSEATDDQLMGVWGSVSRLHAGGISHGALTGSAISVTQSRHEIGDFASGQLASPMSARAVDVVELLYSLSRVFGVERTVGTAVTALGTERMSEVLPFIQLPAISHSERRRTDKPKSLVRSIRDEVARVTGVEAAEPVQLRRVKPKSLVTTAVALFAFSFLISQLSDIDFAAVWQVIEGAEWAWIVMAFIVGQFVYFPEATAMLAAVGYPIPMRPAVILQSSVKFISLAVPSSAGRIAMTATFLRKYGASFTASVVQGSIDTMSGLLVEVVILVVAFLTGTLSLGLETGEKEWGPIILVLAGLVLLVVLLVRHVPRLRDWVMPVVGEAFGALGSVLKDPKRMLALLGSNVASRFVLAVSMWMILVSFDAPLGIWSVLTATVATGLLGGIVPIPGGVGVSEAVLTASLVLFGIDETTAFAAAVIYRVATFYIPSGAGFFAMRWLERNGYV